MPGDANQRHIEEAAATSTSSLVETIWVTAIHLRNPGCPAEACARSLCAGMRGAEIRENTLFDSADPKSLENLSADLRGQSDFRQCACDVCHRPVYALVYRRCDKGVDVARIWPALNDCHARDLSAFVDLVRHGGEEVGTARKQRVEIGHNVVLPDESMVPVALRVEVASHDLALVVNAAGYAASISRQKTEVDEHVILPKRGIRDSAVGGADESNNLAQVVIAESLSASLVVSKGAYFVVVPHNGVIRRSASSREAHDLASIIDPKRIPAWIVTCRKSFGLGFAVFPQHRPLSPIISCASRA